MIDIQHISHQYNEVPALQDITFSVGKGEIFGLLGPDGAGKTTLIRILTTLMSPSDGNAIVNQNDIIRDWKKIRAAIGYMPGRFSLYEDLSVEENLNLFASIFETTIEENYHLIEDIYKQIEPFKKRKAGALSGGMKQKLALSCAMIHAPEVIFLDEPTTGVDPVSRKEFWQMLHKLKSRGITILVSTPYMDEASQCDRVGLLFNGKMLQIDTPDNILKSFQGNLYRLEAEGAHRFLGKLRKNPSVQSAYLNGEMLHFYFIPGKEVDPKEMEDYLKEGTDQNLSVHSTDPTIEDCFLALMSN